MAEGMSYNELFLRNLTVIMMFDILSIFLQGVASNDGKFQHLAHQVTYLHFPVL